MNGHQARRLRRETLAGPHWKRRVRRAKRYWRGLSHLAKKKGPRYE